MKKFLFLLLFLVSNSSLYCEVVKRKHVFMNNTSQEMFVKIVRKGCPDKTLKIKPGRTKTKIGAFCQVEHIDIVFPSTNQPLTQFKVGDKVVNGATFRLPGSDKKGVRAFWQVAVSGEEQPFAVTAYRNEYKTIRKKIGDVLKSEDAITTYKVVAVVVVGVVLIAVVAPYAVGAVLWLPL